MITGDKLDIFLNFRNARKKNNNVLFDSIVVSGGLGTSAPSSSSLRLGVDADGRVRVARKSWLDPIRRIFGLRTKSVKPLLTVPQFFTQIKKSAAELEVLENAGKNYEVFMNGVREMGQTALLEQLEDHLTVRRAEAMMLANGFTNAVSEDVIVRFGQQSPRGLRLDWLENFTRVLPPDVQEKLKTARGLDVFDNFVILHYDPEGKATQLTKKEILAKKDPILFGVVEGSTRLYFIADWIDEYCDLTLDQLMIKLSKRALENI